MALLALSLAGCGGETDSSSCDAATCIFPPTATCDGDSLVSYQGPGLCSKDTDQCIYIPEPATCTLGCANGRCVTSEDLCVGVVCTDPPARACEGDVVLTFESGVCNAGACAYPEVPIDCRATQEVCAEGRCVDPCTQTVCEAPAPRCEGTVLVTVPSMLCDEGACFPAQTVRENCADLAAQGTCQAGACVAPDLCEGVVCDTPPDPWCDVFVLRSYEGPGECVPENGQCLYPSSLTNCALEGQSCDFVAGVNTCVDVDPCAGVECTTPPAAVCDRNVSRRRVSPGFCQNGECVYRSFRVDCTDTEEFCDAGACVERDPCEDVLCPDEAPRFCDGEVAMVPRLASGECIAGECEYAIDRVDCTETGQFCDGGVCVVGDPCDEVVCATPPAAECFGDDAVRYEPFGACVAGDCYYDPIVNACATRRADCVDGACVARDRCAGIVCLDPPPRECASADTVRRFFPEGTCDAGACIYAPLTERCEAGDRCVDGACVGAP